MKKYYYKLQIAGHKPIVTLYNYEKIIAYLKGHNIKIGIVSIRNILRNKIPPTSKYRNIVIEQYQIPTIRPGTKKIEKYVEKCLFLK